MSVTCGWCLVHDHRANPAPSCDCAKPGCPCQAKPDLPTKPKNTAPPTRRRRSR